jgi:hypothetical protein
MEQCLGKGMNDTEAARDVLAAGPGMVEILEGGDD